MVDSYIKLKDDSVKAVRNIKQRIVRRTEDFTNEEIDELVDELDDILEHAVCLDSDYSILQKNRDLADIKFSDNFTISAINLCNKALRILHQNKNK